MAVACAVTELSSKTKKRIAKGRATHICRMDRLFMLQVPRFQISHSGVYCINAATKCPLLVMENPRKFFTVLSGLPRNLTLSRCLS